MTNVAKKKQLPAFLVLTIISLVAAVVLAVTNEVTKGPIAAHAAAERNKAFAAVLPAAGYNELTVPEGHASVTGLFEAVDESGAAKGYTVVAAASGYAGPVAVTLGVGNDGMVTGAVIGDTSFAETAGFGMRWKEETNRWEQFQLIDTANGGSIEAISGATVTSNAVLTATNAAINCVNEVRGVEARDVVTKGAPAAKPIETMELTGGIHEGSARGFQSDVRVQLTMDDANVVTGLVIDATNETPGFGTRATEEASFAEQFVGKTAPFALGDGIDGLTGATVTSKAVIEAVNAACASPENPDAVPFNLGGGEEEPAVETSAEPVPAGAITASAPGFAGGDVHVTITKNEDGTIATLSIDVSDQVPPVCDMVLADSFVNQFIGKTGPFVKGENVDIVSGATFTSEGVIAAVNAALEAPAEETPASDALTAAAPGFGGADVGVTVTLNEDGTIATLDIDVSKQLPPVCDLVLADSFKNQFIGKKGPFEGVDIVTGATFTSEGVIAALNSLFPEAPASDALTAAAPGFGGADVGVAVTLNDDGTIATLDIDVSKQLPPVCDLVLADSFKNQFIGQKGPFEGVDIVSGATFTSEGVINALNSLFPAEAAPAGEEKTGKAQGFQSEVVVTLTVDNGVIMAIKVDSSNETPGFGTRCGEDEAFLAQFVGKKATPDLGEGIDALTGATVTSDAVIVAANAAIGVETGVVEIEETPAAETLTAAAPGFGGADVGVSVTLNEDGTIATLDIDVSKQLPPVCDLVLADSFKNQFIGQKGPFEGVDIVSGATFTSEGVINALNSLFPAEAAPAADALTAAAPGFGGADVGVSVTLNEDGTIATLDIDVSKQLPPVCDLVLADSFKNQFIGQKGPFEGVDIVSGATFTSEGVINALNSLFPVQDMAVTGEEGPAIEETPAAETLTAAAPGFGGADVGVAVTLNEDGTIATLDIDVSKQLPPVCDLVLADSFKNQFIGQKGPFEGVDIVSGATFTSEGVINALNSLFPVQDMAVTGEEGPAAPNAATITVPAFGGQDVIVTVTFAADGTVEALVVDASTQSPGLGMKCAEDGFIDQFIGKAAPFTLNEGIDAVSYATITSQAIVDAVNQAAAAE